MNTLGFFLPIVIFSLASAAVRVVIINDTEGYYWRDYYGDVPRDAVPGGVDKNGRTTYIGQALHISPPNGKLIPGTIDATKRKMYYAWGDGPAFEVTNNVKILCSQHPEHFEWIDTDISQAQIMPQKNLVKGGYDTSYHLFIGKIHVAGEVVVGKVTLPVHSQALGYVSNGRPYFVQGMFKILSFNADNVPKENSCIAADTVNITSYA